MSGKKEITDTIKYKMSEHLNDTMGLSGDERVDFTRLTDDDLIDLYKLLTNPRRVVQMAKHIALNNRPGIAEEVIMNTSLGTAASEFVMEQLDNRPLLGAFVDSIMSKRKNK